MKQSSATWWWEGALLSELPLGVIWNVNLQLGCCFRFPRRGFSAEGEEGVHQSAAHAANGRKQLGWDVLEWGEMMMNPLCWLGTANEANRSQQVDGCFHRGEQVSAGVWDPWEEFIQKVLTKCWGRWSWSTRTDSLLPQRFRCRPQQRSWKGNMPRLKMHIPLRIVNLTVVSTSDCTFMAPTIVVVSAEL